MNHTFSQAIQIGPHQIGPGKPPMIIAEIGGNHGGDPELAEKMIKAAAGAGAHAVKFQAYRTETFLRHDSAYYDELAAEELSPEILLRLKTVAESFGVLFMASIFDHNDGAFYRELDMPLVKISSGDITNLPLLKTAADLNRPVALSTGASTVEEIGRALDYLHDQNASDVVLMQCTSLYPCPDDQINLAAIPAMRQQFGLPVGFSDHSEGIEIPLAACALGAIIIEKHFTIDRSLPGGDNEMSATPDELASLVKGASRIAMALGSAVKSPTEAEADMREPIRRSIVAARPITKGKIIDPADLALKRPGTGLPPSKFFNLVGKTADTNIWADEPIAPEMIMETVK